MITGLILNFFGGTAFRLIWGEISNWWTASRDHKYELERLRMQAQLDAENHTRRMEVIKFEADRGVEMIRVQGEVDVTKLDAEIFQKGLDLVNAKTGIFIVDLWKGAIQPALASMMIYLVFMHYHRAGWVLDDRGWELAGAVFGVFIADRMLFKRGK